MSGGRALGLFLGCKKGYMCAGSGYEPEVCPVDEYAYDASNNDGNSEDTHVYMYESAVARVCALVLAFALVGCVACVITLAAVSARRRAYVTRRPFARHRAEQMV